ncbi:MAG: hypothetical protein Rubg2KO_16800 [Rubricoccaceae bacterium]
MNDVTPFAQRLRILWLSICAGGALILVIMGWMAASGQGGTLADSAETVFYLIALLSIGALGMALFLIRTMETRLHQAASEAEGKGTIQSLGLAALAAVDASAVGSAVAAFLTGDLLILAFGAPLFAFAALTWPSDGRVTRWLEMTGS